MELDRAAAVFLGRRRLQGYRFFAPRSGDRAVTITRVGTNQKYSEGWDKIFAKGGSSKSSGSKGAAAKPAAKPSPKKAGKKAAPKKPAKKGK
jgi:hypothetical protein